MVEIMTKNDFAYAELRRMVLTGELPAGEVIPQAKIAEQLGVSTTPLREAIKRLVAEGVVEVAAHRDARVAALSGAEALHLYEVREALDPMAASLAAQRRTAGDLQEIERNLRRLKPIRASSDIAGMLAHRDFHRAVYASSHNPILVASLDQLWDKADRYRSLALREAPPARADQARIAREHADLYDAVRGGDEKAAAAVMLAHIRGSHGRRAVAALGTGAP